MKGDTILELLILVSQRDIAPPSSEQRAQAALTELYDRYAPAIYDACRYMCKKYRVRDVDESAEELNQEVWIKIYSKAEKFTPDSANEEEVADQFIRWAAGIGRNALLDLLKNNFSNISLGEILRAAQSDEEIENSDEENSGQKENEKLRYIERFFGTLSERDSDILRTAFYHYPYNTPSNELDRLCEQYSITKANIRQIKSRLLLKLIDDAVEKFGKKE